MYNSTIELKIEYKWYIYISKIEWDDTKENIEKWLDIFISNCKEWIADK